MENGWIQRKEDDENKAKVIGTCSGCNEEIWDYEEDELVVCICGVKIHKHCLIECCDCFEKMCKNCITDDGNDNYYCEDCKKG